MTYLPHENEKKKQKNSTAQHQEELEWITQGIKASRGTYEFLAQNNKTSKKEGIQSHFKKSNHCTKKSLKKQKL